MMIAMGVNVFRNQKAYCSHMPEAKASRVVAENKISVVRKWIALKSKVIFLVLLLQQL